MPSRRLRRPVRPVVVVACLAGVGMLAFASLASLASAQTDSQRPAGVSAQTTGGSSSTTTTTAPSGSGSTASSGVTLNGEGAAGPYKEVTQWQNDLATAQSPINLNYTVTGSLDGRQDFLSKQADSNQSHTLVRINFQSSRKILTGLFVLPDLTIG